MVGFGAEDDHFVFELTYNYGVTAYRKGTDFREVLLHRVTQAGDDLISRATNAGFALTEAGDGSAAVEVAGMAFRFAAVPASRPDPVLGVALNVRSLEASRRYWQAVLGMSPTPVPPGCVGAHLDASWAALAFSEAAPRLVLHELGAVVDRGEAFGRIAFSCAEEDVPRIHALAAAGAHGGAVVHAPVTLPTPGKADVVVVILADPDGQEICFVGDVGFRALSAPAPGAEAIDWAMRDRLDEAQARYEARLQAKAPAQ
eukprot:EG_transcript_14288